MRIALAVFFTAVCLLAFWVVCYLLNDQEPMSQNERATHGTMGFASLLLLVVSFFAAAICWTNVFTNRSKPNR